MCLVSLCIQDSSLHTKLLLTHFLFSDKEGPCNPVWVTSDSPTTMFKGCILQPEVFNYIFLASRVQLLCSRVASSKPRYFAIFLRSCVTRECTTCTVGFALAVCFTPQRQRWPSDPYLIKLHLPPARRPKMSTMLPLMRMIPLLMSMNNHQRKHWRALDRHLRRNREDQIANGNGSSTIGGRVPITLMLNLCLLFAQT